MISKVRSEISRVNPFITRVITYLVSGMQQASPCSWSHIPIFRHVDRAPNHCLFRSFNGVERVTCGWRLASKPGILQVDHLLSLNHGSSVYIKKIITIIMMIIIIITIMIIMIYNNNNNNDNDNNDI